MPFEVRFDDPADERRPWRRVADAPLKRLYEDVEHAYCEARRRCWEETGSPMAREHRVVIIDGWPFVSGPDTDEAAQRRLERHSATATGYAKQGKTYYEAVLRPEIVATVERLRRAPRRSAPVAELVAHVEESMAAFAHICGDLHWRMAGVMAGSGDPFEWPKVYAEVTGRPASEATVLLGGLTNEMTKAIRALQRLAALAASDPELLAAVESAELSALDRDTPSFRRFRLAFRRLLRSYGVRVGRGWGSKSEHDSPTWSIRPRIPLRMIATYARSDLDAVAKKELGAARARRALESKVRRALRADPERLARFDQALAQARNQAFVIEDHNHWMDQSATGVLREAVHRLGSRLVRDDVIDEPDGVMHLSLDELRSVAGGDATVDVPSLVGERARLHAEREKLDPPDRIGEASSADEQMMKVFAPEGAGLDGGVLRGIAASAGRHTGRARVCEQTFEPPDLADGDILVAVDAGPSWTPVFAVLGGLVLDRGASFQHAAVMAREFGIPAVLGTKDATSVIRDGQTITVDGDAGVVELSF